MGYSLFKVAFQGDSVGNRLKEVQEGVNDLAKFGKMVDLASFMPFEYVPFFFFFLPSRHLWSRKIYSPLTKRTETTSRPLVKSTMFRKVLPLRLLFLSSS